MNSSDFQNIIKYQFKDSALIRKALTHSSFVKENVARPERNNERLEFLGDAFFDAIISEELYKRMESVPEGTLTKIRAMVVCEESLAEQGRRLSIGKYIYMSSGEEHSGGRHRDSILADAMEAVIGALFLDGGYDEAKKFVLNTFSETLDKAISGKFHADYKTEIQELLQAFGEVRIGYKTVRETGPDHNKTFFVNLLCNGKLLGQGQGKSKKIAEQNAAKEALERGVTHVF